MTMTMTLMVHRDTETRRILTITMTITMTLFLSSFVLRFSSFAPLQTPLQTPLLLKEGSGVVRQLH